MKRKGYLRKYQIAGSKKEEDVSLLQQFNNALVAAGRAFYGIDDAKYKQIQNRRAMMTNPLNWGVSDYSHEKDFNKAYAGAKKEGANEFMWNGKRFAVKDSGKKLEPWEIAEQKSPDFFKNYLKNYFINQEKNITPGNIKGHRKTYGDPETRYKDVLNLHYRYGNPLVSIESSESQNHGSGDYGRANYSNEDNKMYIFGLNQDPNVTKIDTANLIDDYIEELLHSRQSKDWGSEGFLNKLNEDLKRNNVFYDKTLNDWVGYDEKMYKDPKSIEYVHESQGFPLKQRILFRDYDFENSADFAYARQQVLEKYKNKAFSPYENQHNIRILQKALSEQGYDMSSSLKKDGTYDGIWGTDTKIAFENWQKKNKKKYGGYLPKAQSIGNFIPSWANPYNWDVADYSDKGDFNTAYSAAKKAGEQEFMYKGKRYNTKYAGTPRQEVGAYGVKGKPVHSIEQNHPSQVNLYPMFGKYIPGHVSVSVTNDPESASIDYSKAGNYPFGIGRAKREGERSYYVYGADQNKIYNKAMSLPMGEFGWLAGETEFKPSDWNLFTNNCADNVCDAFGIPRSKGIQTPVGAVFKIKEKYPTIDVTGRTYDDYYDLGVRLRPISFNKPEQVLNQANNLIGIISSPDLIGTEASEKIVFALQNALSKIGYKLPNSIKEDGSFDRVLGAETQKALKAYQMKNSKSTKKKYGGYLPKAQFADPFDPNNPVESDMITYGRKAPRTNIGSGMYATANSQLDEDIFGINKPLESTAFSGQYRNWLDNQSYAAPQGDGSMYGGGDGSGSSSAQSKQGIKLDSGAADKPSFGQKAGAFASRMWKGANADNILLGTKALNNLLEKTPDYSQFQRNYKEPGQSMSRGDWTTNQGFLQPNRLGYFDKFSVGTGSMQFGGEVDMTDDEIYEFLAAGGELEFID